MAYDYWKTGKLIEERKAKKAAERANIAALAADGGLIGADVVPLPKEEPSKLKEAA